MAGCRKHDIAARTYYDWLDKYNAHGIDGLECRKLDNSDAELKQLRKENRLLKEILAPSQSSVNSHLLSR